MLHSRSVTAVAVLCATVATLARPALARPALAQQPTPRPLPTTPAPVTPPAVPTTPPTGPAAARPGAAAPAARNPFAPSPVAPSPLALPIEAPYVRTTPPTDRVIQRIVEEGTQRSQVVALSQALMDSVGPRLTGSPAALGASDWAIAQYRRWGVPARREQYGTWNAWRRGAAHVALVAPRVRTLETTMLAWSPDTRGQWVEGEVVILPDVATPEQFDAWATANARGKVVLASAPTLSCRAAGQWQEYGTPESRAEAQRVQDSVRTSWPQRALAAADLQPRLQAAGAVAVFTHTFSGYPGIDKIFGSPRQRVPTFDVSCEDYGLLFRMAERGQGPRVRLTAQSEFQGERPVFNTLAELRGSSKSDEYVILSAHFDSWDGASGATDNGTGTVTMMEAMRILKQVLPRPTRTILVGHWGGEEQGLNGSRAFTEDHPEVVRGVQALFNQDNGTGRVANMSAGGLSGAGPVLRRYLGEAPGEITRFIRFDDVGSPAAGGSDNASFACYGAPAFGLNSLSWDYGLTTWHTNRDTFDKVVMDDLRSNAILAAVLAYQASEDPRTIPRDRVDPLPPNPITGRAASWPQCTKALRSSAGYRR